MLGQKRTKHREDHCHDDDLDGQKEGILDEAGGQIVEISLSIEEITPETSQENIDQIIDQRLGGEDAKPVKSFSIQEKTVDAGGQDLTEQISREIGTAGEQKEADRIREEGDDGTDDGAINGTAQ